MDKIEKIRAEIERRKGYISVTHFAEELLSFLDTLSEEPDKDLEEAAEEYAQLDNEGVWKDGGKYKGFIAGAEWQYQKDRGEFAKIKAKTWCEGFDAHKEQMMKEAVEGEVHPDDCEIWVNLVGYGYKFNDGDKVSIIVLPKEN